jgi:hypothetical protein
MCDNFCLEKEEVHFWPLNYSRSLVLAIEPENQESSTIELLKPFTIDPRAVLVAGFADVDSTWRWDPPVSLFYMFSPHSFFLLSFSLFLEHSSGRPPAQPPLSPRRHLSPAKSATEGGPCCGAPRGGAGTQD